MKIEFDIEKQIILIICMILLYLAGVIVGINLK